MRTAVLPEMRKYRYDLGLAKGSIAAGGTLGILKPFSGLLKILVIGYDPCYLSSGKLIKYVLCGFGSLL